MSDGYGNYRGKALPPPGREHIIVRTPNPLPAPKSLGKDSPTLRPLPQPETTKPPADAGRWLVLAMIELCKRFLGMAVAAGFSEARQRHECTKCGNVWKG